MGILVTPALAEEAAAEALNSPRQLLTTSTYIVLHQTIVITVVADCVCVVFVGLFERLSAFY
jgi:hypothetical protein